MDVASSARAFYDWATSAGPGPIVIVVAAVIGAAGVLINGWRQRRHDTLAAIRQATRQDRQRMRDRLTPLISELMQVRDEMTQLASDLTHRPDDGVRDAPDAIRNARRRLDLVRDTDIRATRDELIAINGRFVQWSGILRGLRDDANAGQQMSPRLAQKADDLEDEVSRRLNVVGKILDDLLTALEQ